jgi:MarR family transcriptional regulator, transcriptional regulator for hemolysin
MDWRQHLGFLLDDVAYLYATRFKEHVKVLSLTLHQCKALAVLANCEGINQRRLGETSDIVSTSLVRILDTLETGGLVKRNPDPHDRRAHLLTTTESAKPVVQHIWRAVSKANAEALKDLAIRDLPVLVELLARVRANLVALEPLYSEAECPNDVDATAIRNHGVSDSPHRNAPRKRIPLRLPSG